MKKVTPALVAAILFGLISCTTIPVGAEAGTFPTPNAAKPEIVGGWYPVFFDKYDAAQVRTIVDNIRAGHVARVTITYDDNYILAKQILSKIQEQVNFAVEFEQIKRQDGTAKFNHKRVVVTVYNLAK